jgi:hypothetical protein
MTNRRKELLSRLYLANPTKEEQVLIQLTIERICVDMCDFYERFYAQEGPGAMVYVPRAEEDSKSMFYLTVSHMITALDDFNRKEMEGPAEVMQKAIARAEALDPDKEALFIIQDENKMSLIHYNLEKPTGGLGEFVIT